MTKKEKGRRRNSSSKVGIEAYGDNFWDSEGVLLIDYCQRDYYEWPILREFIGSGTRGSRTEATWEVIARSAVLQDNASVTRRGFLQVLKDTGFSEIDHPP
ncbi:hypothetical protein EVAR_53782_1 [Eumeta japonica]|uniref:Uncharacterized protein n=1 Tax=Eumeta variegata TaxID=151549 RepID=A0A4C1Z5H4_EUMVA|nr:hypothetical protein EVAR_53782_1 [Eumeta japonica]